MERGSDHQERLADGRGVGVLFNAGFCSPEWMMNTSIIVPITDEAVRGNATTKPSTRTQPARSNWRASKPMRPNSTRIAPAVPAIGAGTQIKLVKPAASWLGEQRSQGNRIPPTRAVSRSRESRRSERDAVDSDAVDGVKGAESRCRCPGWPKFEVSNVRG